MDEELNQLITNYQMSDEGKRLLSKVTVVMLVSITAGGKNTVIRELLKSNNYHYVISHTTRAPRENQGIMEQPGREYWFVTFDEMKEKLRNGDFLEAKLVHGKNIYGTSFDELQRAYDNGKAALLEIDVQGVGDIIQAKPDAKPMFLLPPSFEEWLKRIDRRGAVDNEDLRDRMETAEIELKRALDDGYFSFVINDKLEQTVADVGKVVAGEDIDLESGRQKAMEILAQLQDYLSS